MQSQGRVGCFDMCRLDSAKSALWPGRCSLIATFRRLAISLGAVPVLVWLASSRNVTTPMELIFYAPMTTDPGVELFGAGLVSR